MNWIRFKEDFSELRIGYVSWDSICTYRNKGGLGLIDLEIKNKILLTKWLWRFGIEQDSLWRDRDCKERLG